MQSIYCPIMEVNTECQRRQRIHFYDPKLESSPELDPDAVSYYLTIIGIPRWMIELGRMSIITKVSLLLSHIALPREGHLEAAVHVMAHVGQRYNSRLLYHPSYPEIDHSVFRECDWSEFYRDAKEAIPMNAPEPQGKEVDICMFVVSSYAGDKVSCRLRSGFLIYGTQQCSGSQRNSLQ